MSKTWKKAVASLFALPLLSIASARPLSAEIIGTLSALEATQRDRDLDTLNRALPSEQVRQQLTKWGVAPDQVDARVAALTDDELRMLAQRVDSMPAGGRLPRGDRDRLHRAARPRAGGRIDIFKKLP